MKPFIALTATAAVLSIVGCGPSQAEIDAANAKKTADSLATLAAMEKSYAVDASTSNITWAGHTSGAKVYGHHGNIALSGGMFTVKGGMLTGGKFEVNMKSITPLDSNYAPDGSKEGTKANLMMHLTTGDFFLTDSFPTATFVVKSVEGNTATGELTVKGKTNEEKITDIAMTEENGKAKATGKLVFDRQKYGVSWKHFLKDVLLADDIELNVELTGTPQ